MTGSLSQLAEVAVESSEPISTMFGLSYASYYVVPRLALQSMSIEWQREFVNLVDQLPQTPEYEVILPGQEIETDEHGRRLATDPWADYRHGSIAEILKAEASR